MRVYRWPPALAVVGAEWTVEDPVSRSVSLLTGRVQMSAAQRRRRVAVLNVEGAYGDGGGYIEALKELLRGGIHAVRLHSHTVNFGETLGAIIPTNAQQVALKTPDLAGQNLRLVTGSDYLTGQTVTLFTGTNYNPAPYTLTVLSPNQGMGRANVAGMPPLTDMARVGQFVTVFSEDGTTYETRRLLRAVRSASDGTASIWTAEPFTADGNVEFGTRDTGIFLPDEMPRAVRPAWQAWQVGWSFREIFADEIAPDTFTEVDPWG